MSQRAGHHVLVNREIVHQIVPLRNDADAAAQFPQRTPAQLSYFDIVYQNAARGGRNEAVDGAQQRRFARAARSQNRHALAPAHGARHAVQDGVLAVANHKIANVERVISGRQDSD